jgi:hypothetical protein
VTSRRQRRTCGDFVNLKIHRIKFMNQFLGGVYRDECMYVFVSVSLKRIRCLIANRKKPKGVGTFDC